MRHDDHTRHASGGAGGLWDGGIVQSLLAEVGQDAIDRFLSAVDVVMNSNTLLLKADAGQSLTVDNRQGLLDAYLRSDLFERMMREADRQREWYNLSDFLDDPEGSGNPAGEGAPVGLLREGCRAGVASLREEEFIDRLHWMLTEAPSPYRHHLPADEAVGIVGDFLREVLGPAGSGGRGAGQGWQFASVEPDFLRSSEYHTDKQPLRPVYFDGWVSDTATLFHCGPIFYLLLTNGSP
ncbi:hypothetical protein ACFXA3_04380 [Streptomyces sp. NPDC059456]|uniref:hypothetical protein n=1 Tax=Streptomyces sp. NPDC059456 TaxID=3346838 RepID=UPI0036CAF1CF